MKTDREGRTELHYAANDGDTEKVRSFIKAGYDVNLQDSNGWSPLHFAAQKYSEEITRILLEAGAAIDPQDSHGNTPLWRAVINSRGKGDVIVLLRAKGADPLKKNNHDVSPVKLSRTMSNDVKQFFSDLPDDQ